jgi:hypothetical protein
MAQVGGPSFKFQYLQKTVIKLVLLWFKIKLVHPPPLEKKHTHHNPITQQYIPRYYSTRQMRTCVHTYK